MFTGILMQTAVSGKPKEYPHRVILAQPITNDSTRDGFSMIDIQVPDALFSKFLGQVNNVVTVVADVDQRQYGKNTYTNFTAKTINVLGAASDFVFGPDGVPLAKSAGKTATGRAAA